MFVLVPAIEFVKLQIPAPDSSHSLEPSSLTSLKNPQLVTRVIMTALPAFILVVTAVFIVWGEKGLVRRYELQSELTTANLELAEVQRQNQRTLRKLKAMEVNAKVMERVAGDQLNMAAPGSRIYRFDDLGSGGLKAD